MDDGEGWIGGDVLKLFVVLGGMAIDHYARMEHVGFSLTR